MNDQTNDRIAVMTVEFHISRQPIPYNNVRCGVSLPVFVRPEDNLAAVLNEALTEVRALVQEEVNLQFESFDIAAPYNDESEPRFNLLRVPQERGIYAILPVGLRPNGWDEAMVVEADHHRAGYLRGTLNTRHHAAHLFDCSDGYPVSGLPVLETVHRYRVDNHHFYFIVNRDQPKPRDLKEIYGWLSRQDFTATSGNILQIVQESIRETDWPLYDCRDGDFTKLPAPKIADVAEADTVEAEYPDDHDISLNEIDDDDDPF